MFETGEPYSREALVAALTHLQDETAAYLEAMPLPIFFAPQGQAWAPAAHARHLAVPVRLVARALRLPRVVLQAAFGRAAGPSRGFAAVREEYLAALGRGAQAPYTPSGKPASADPAASRARIVADLGRAVTSLTTNLSRWDEPGLDRYRLPHPLLGRRLTIREMACFILYHNAHHMRRVAERASGTNPEHAIPGGTPAS